MATAPTPKIEAYWTVSGSSTTFVLDDPVKGVLDNAIYLLSGDVAVDITAYGRSIQIRRGRARDLDEYTAGVATVVADNTLRTFDPLYAAGTYYGNILPGKRATISANNIPIHDGKIDDWDYTYPLSKDSTVQFDVVDALAELGSKDFDAWTTTAGQTAGTRLTSILDRAEVSFGPSRSIETGTATLQADSVSWGSNVLTYAQKVVKADYGRLFAAKDGTLTFVGSAHVFSGVNAPVLADDGSGIGYTNVGVDYGTELLFNRVSVDATGFTKQTVSDSTSILANGGVRTLSLSGLPLQTEAQAFALATYLLALYKEPVTRFSSVTVALHAESTTDQNKILNLDLSSIVRVKYTPNGISTAIDKFCTVEGITHTIGPAYHSVTLSLATLSDGYDTSQNLILDDATYGILDTDRVAF